MEASDVNIAHAISEGLQKLGLESLKENQGEAIVCFLKSKDTFVCLPTGYGKSVIYALLPSLSHKISLQPSGENLKCWSIMIDVRGLTQTTIL